MRILSLLSLFTITFLTGCVSDAMTDDIADRIAAPAWMIHREIPAGAYTLAAYERMHERNEPANVYIEGDSLAWFTKLGLDADPKNPVALNLAAHDKGNNVAYLARPCQFTNKPLGERCAKTEWNEARFSQEVLNSYNEALDNIKSHYDVTEFNLIGFSGGAAIAAVLAAERSDVVSLKTIAGMMDHNAFTNHHSIPALHNSINPVDYTDQLKSIPQNHFVGGNDQVMPFSVLSSYLQAIGASECVQYSLIQEAEHQQGWVDKWPALKATPLPCSDSNQGAPAQGLSEYRPDTDETVILQAPIYRIPRDMGVKP